MFPLSLRIMIFEYVQPKKIFFGTIKTEIETRKVLFTSVAAMTENNIKNFPQNFANFVNKSYLLFKSFIKNLFTGRFL